jgi:hypothetical protein
VDQHGQFLQPPGRQRGRLPQRLPAPQLRRHQETDADQKQRDSRAPPG